MLLDPQEDMPLSELILTASCVADRRIRSLIRHLELLLDDTSDVYGCSAMDDKVTLLRYAIIEHDHLVSLRGMGRVNTEDIP